MKRMWIFLKHLGGKVREKNQKAYVDFMDLKKAYDGVKSEVLLHVLIIYDMGGKLLNAIKNIHVYSLA